MKKDFKLEPWRTYHKSIEVLPIDRPPCEHCLYFKPIRNYQGTLYDGVQICHAVEMEQDFSCFKPSPCDDY